MSVGFRVGSFTVTAELLSRTKRAVFAADTKFGYLSHLRRQKQLSRNVERVWRYRTDIISGGKNNAGVAVQAAEV